MVIHTVKVPVSSGAEKEKLSDFGIELQKIEIDKPSIFQADVNNTDKNQLSKRKALRIRSLGENFRSESLDEFTDLSTGQFEIVGVNNISCKSLSIKQIEQILVQEHNMDFEKGNKETILLVKGHGKDHNEMKYARKGVSSDCWCAQNCTPDGYCGECCCTIQ